MFLFFEQTSVSAVKMSLNSLFPTGTSLAIFNFLAVLFYLYLWGEECHLFLRRKYETGSSFAIYILYVKVVFMCVYRVDQDQYYRCSSEKLYFFHYDGKLVKSHIMCNFYDYFVCIKHSKTVDMEQEVKELCGGV